MDVPVVRSHVPDEPDVKELSIFRSALEKEPRYSESASAVRVGPARGKVEGEGEM